MTTGTDTTTALPPGQHLTGSFIRYGSHLFRAVPDLTRIDGIHIRGTVITPRDVALADLADLGHVDMTADFHCVAGWSIHGLRWGGVPFRAFYERVIQPIAVDGITHLRFVGADRFRSVLPVDDTLEADVLLATELNGAPLGGDHGGPVRLVCPSRYGYKSVKHLDTIELHPCEPSEGHQDPVLNALLKLLHPHPRARVATEERHRYLASRAVRWPYFHVLHPIFRSLCKIGDRRSNVQ